MAENKQDEPVTRGPLDMLLEAEHYLNQGAFEESLRMVDECLSLYPESSPAYNHLAFLQLLSGDLVHAEAHFQKAMHLDPAYPSTYPNYARFLNVAGRFDECLALYAQSKSVAGIKADMMALEAAESLEALGRLEEAVQLQSRETPTVVYAKDCLDRCKIKLEVA